MAAFHLRIPDELYEKLRTRAAEAGRSINSEILELLEPELARPSPAELDARLRDLQRRLRLPEGAPKPEELIRELRDSRD